MNAHADWYLTRGTGVVALALVTAAVVLGIISSLRIGGARTPRFVMQGLHRNISLLTVAFVAVHVATTLLDGYVPISIVDAVVPFVSAYRPVWLGLGALASDILLALVVTSLVRVRLGLRTWRAVHWFAYACFPVALVHALGTGTDATQHWLLGLSIGCAALVGAAVLARLWQLRRAHAVLAVAGVVVLAVLGAGVTAWARNGPLAPGWARRAGTPTASATSTISTSTAAVRRAAHTTRSVQ